MQQVFGTDKYYIQDEGRGHEMLFVPFWPVNSGENTDVHMHKPVIQSHNYKNLRCFDVPIALGPNKVLLE